MNQFELSVGEFNDVLGSVASKYNARNLQINDGMVNYVGLADEQLVIKVPKSRKSASGLVIEAAALELLEDSAPLSAPVPRLVELSTSPTYIVSTYLPGVVIGTPELQKLSLKERDILGHDIGAYVLSQASEVNFDAASLRIPPPEQQDSWEHLFEEAVERISPYTFPSPSTLADQLHILWKEYRTTQLNEQFTQGDLRLGNMVVSNSNRLCGVFDFGRAGTGDATYEVHPLANIDPTILNGTIDELESNGATITKEHIRLWDSLKDVTKLSHGIVGKAKPSFYRRASLKIPQQYPGLDWSELNQLPT